MKGAIWDPVNYRSIERRLLSALSVERGLEDGSLFCSPSMKLVLREFLQAGRKGCQLRPHHCQPEAGNYSENKC